MLIGRPLDPLGGGPLLPRRDLAESAAPTPLVIFNLSAPALFAAPGVSHSQMVICAPTALSMLDSAQIMVEPAPGQVAYLSDARWGDRLPVLVHARVIEAFENGGKGPRVARPGDGIKGDLQISLDIRAFAVRLDPSGPRAVVEMSARAIGNPSVRIVGARIFTADVPVLEFCATAAVQALEAALHEVLVELVAWACIRF